MRAPRWRAMTPGQRARVSGGDVAAALPPAEALPPHLPSLLSWGYTVALLELKYTRAA